MNLRTIIPIKGNLNMSIAGKRSGIAPFLMEVDFPDDGVRTAENILGNLYKAPHEPVDKYYKLMQNRLDMSRFISDRKYPKNIPAHIPLLDEDMIVSGGRGEGRVTIRIRIHLDEPKATAHERILQAMYLYAALHKSKDACRQFRKAFMTCKRTKGLSSIID